MMHLLDPADFSRNWNWLLFLRHMTKKLMVSNVQNTNINLEMYNDFPRIEHTEIKCRCETFFNRCNRTNRRGRVTDSGQFSLSPLKINSHHNVFAGNETNYYLSSEILTMLP